MRERVVGGGQIGYNWQIDNLVLGLETDIQATAEKNSITGSASGVTLTETNSIPYFGTARGRLGWAINRWMPYVTGGWGYGGLSASLTATGAAIGTVSASTSTLHSLWVIGGGVEVALPGNFMSWKIEYLYMDTGTITNNISTPLGILAINARATNNVARLGLNYRF